MIAMFKDFFTSILTNNKTGEKSLTALFAIVSFIICIVACFMEMLEYSKSTSDSIELFLICMGAYLGRRIDFPIKSKKIPVEEQSSDSNPT